MIWCGAMIRILRIRLVFTRKSLDVFLSSYLNLELRGLLFTCLPQVPFRFDWLRLYPKSLIKRFEEATTNKDFYWPLSRCVRTKQKKTIVTNKSFANFQVLPGFVVVHLGYFKWLICCELIVEGGGGSDTVFSIFHLGTPHFSEWTLVVLLIMDL